jgi:hypothetical protein
MIIVETSCLLKTLRVKTGKTLILIMPNSNESLKVPRDGLFYELVYSFSDCNMRETKSNSQCLLDAKKKKKKILC